MYYFNLQIYKYLELLICKKISIFFLRFGGGWRTPSLESDHYIEQGIEEKRGREDASKAHTKILYRRTENRRDKLATATNRKRLEANTSSESCGSLARRAIDNGGPTKPRHAATTSLLLTSSNDKIG
jgi:hypothetical protein